MKYYKGNFCPRVEQMGFIENLLTPEVKQTLVGSAKESAMNVVAYVWQEYKVPIVAISSVLIVTIILENMANIKILSQK